MQIIAAHLPMLLVVRPQVALDDQSTYQTFAASNMSLTASYERQAQEERNENLMPLVLELIEAQRLALKGALNK